MLTIFNLLIISVDFSLWQTTPQLSAIKQQTFAWARDILSGLHWSAGLTQVSAVSPGWLGVDLESLNGYGWSLPCVTCYPSPN